MIRRKLKEKIKRLKKSLCESSCREMVEFNARGKLQTTTRKQAELIRRLKSQRTYLVSTLSSISEGE